MSKSSPSRKDRGQRPSQTAPKRASTAFAPSSHPTVSGRWLLTALVIVLVTAVLCAWGTLCLLFWQGSWQLLYHPTSAVTRTPANANLGYESVGFATNAAGEPQLRGWWIPASLPARYTAIYLHGAQGNLGDAVSALAQLHSAGLNLFAFDYRGYGQSHFAHPTEDRMIADADSALNYLTGTRHISAASIILIGRDLGANLALEMAAKHPDLAGAVLEQPLETPTAAIFNDPRAHLVPARLLVSDRWDTNAVASNLLIPSLWLYWTPARDAVPEDKPLAFQKAPDRKMLVWLTNSSSEQQQFQSALSGWIDQLPSATP